MKIEMVPRIYSRRGEPVEVGNVYANPSLRYYRIVMAVVNQNGTRPWNNVTCIHVNSFGDIVGSSNQPQRYVQEHQDLVGRVVGEMPSMKIRWLKEPETTVPLKRKHK